MKNILLEFAPSECVKLIVEFGSAQTATVHERDIVPNE